MIRAVVGSGGKTTLIKKMAEEFVYQGKKVFVTTSTHMKIEENTLLTDDAQMIIEKLCAEGFVMAGLKTGEKIKELPQNIYEKVCKFADEVLIEADGSNHLPVKFPNETEPVIYDNAEEIIVVCGMHALGQKVKDTAHRLELVKACLCAEDDTILTAQHIQRLVMQGYVKPLRERYPDKSIVIKANCDCLKNGGTLYERVAAKLIEAEKEVSLIQEDWFLPQPQLIICGGGHVAYDLVKIASCLDFHIKVIDDREEFANAERFANADEVICDSFDHLEKYLDPYGYYVVLTRGHKYDYDCVKMILPTSYQYLGMIGSRKKVKITFDRLMEEGFEEKQIQTIHAPIGLDIKAKTPAEIAVSILAEIIAEKNSRYTAFISRELLEVKGRGVLCMIIEKHGSSPRGEGSMMFVTEDKIIDSIGGGAVEYAAIQDARICKTVMVKEYQLNQEQSENLGMICGGSNKVLFVPL